MDNSVFRTTAEVMKGVTNLPILLAALLFFFLLQKRKADRKSIFLFLFLSVSAFLGITVHTFALPVWVSRALWVVLFAFMYETLRLAFIVLTAAAGHTEVLLYKTRLPVLLSELACWGFCAGLTLGGSLWDLYVMGAWALCVFSLPIGLCFTKRPGIGKLRLLLAILVSALAAVLVEPLTPPALGVVICHGLLVTSLYFLYKIGAAEKATPTPKTD